MYKNELESYYCISILNVALRLFLMKGIIHTSLSFNALTLPANLQQSNEG